MWGSLEPWFTQRREASAAWNFGPSGSRSCSCTRPFSQFAYLLGICCHYRLPRHNGCDLPSRRKRACCFCDVGEMFLAWPGFIDTLPGRSSARDSMSLHSTSSTLQICTGSYSYPHIWHDHWARTCQIRILAPGCRAIRICEFCSVREGSR